MAIQSIATFLNWFKKRAKPTAAQFADLFDSFAHKTRDFDQMGGGLKPHNPNRPYSQGEAIFIGGKIRTSKVNLPIGAYDANQWEDFTSNPASLGLTPWTPDEVIVYDAEALAQRTHRLAILEALADSQGIEPFVDPDWEEYWVVVVYTEGGYIPLYLGGGFVKKDRVYSYQLATAVPKGFYRCNRSDVGFDGGFKSTNFADELANGDWVLEATLAGGTGLTPTFQQVTPDPINTSTNGIQVSFVNCYDRAPEYEDDFTKGYVAGKSKWIDTTTGIEFLCTQDLEEDALWLPLSGSLEPIVALEPMSSFTGIVAKIMTYSVVNNICTCFYKISITMDYTQGDASFFVNAPVYPSGPMIMAGVMQMPDFSLLPLFEQIGETIKVSVKDPFANQPLGTFDFVGSIQYAIF